jgi:hypothetical protein
MINRPNAYCIGRYGVKPKSVQSDNEKTDFRSVRLAPRLWIALAPYAAEALSTGGVPAGATQLTLGTHLSNSTNNPKISVDF